MLPMLMAGDTVQVGPNNLFAVVVSVESLDDGESVKVTLRFRDIHTVVGHTHRLDASHLTLNDGNSLHTIPLKRLERSP